VVFNQGHASEPSQESRPKNRVGEADLGLRLDDIIFMPRTTDKNVMQKSDINIAIVDDDASLGKVIQEALTRAGFKASHFMRPDEALASAKLHTIHALVIDCMLPKMNGRDLAKKFRSDLSATIPIVMISGVYKDKNFVRDTIQATGAVSFLTKPFELSQLIEVIETSLAPLVDAPLHPVHALLLADEISASERIKAVNAAGQVHGYDLPWTLQVLMHPKVSGHLTIVTDDGATATVGFGAGRIVQVNKRDAKSYLGVLLLEHGFITQAEIDAALNSSDKNRRVGERLIEANVLSPHAVQIALDEQQGIRLSSIINGKMNQLSFIATDEMREDSIIDRSLYTELIGEWIQSKLTLEWMKTFFMGWETFTLVRGPEYSNTHLALRNPIVLRVPDLFKILFSGLSVGAAIQKLSRTNPELEVYQAVQMVLTTRLGKFGEASNSVDFEFHKARLQRLIVDMDKQNMFERLGLTLKAKEQDIKKSYHELAKIMHPDKLSPETPKDVRDLAQTAFAKVTEAYEILSESTKRGGYLQELEQGKAESVFLADQTVEQARAMLSRGDAKKGKELIDQAIAMAPPNSEAKLVLIWARLKSSGSRTPAVLEDIKKTIASIPPEDRHNSTFFFVKGLVQQASGENDSARRSFENAVSIDADFVDAKRELNVLTLNMQKSKKSTDLFSTDLRDLVGGLFKRR
jgi:CheY-like chemotaxis protein/curved DNA-binding protein CbpA